VNGVHDMGGMQGFGPVPYDPADQPFHEEWESRAMAVASLTINATHANVDQFRHAIERIPPAEYLTATYFGRWLRGAERLAAEVDLFGEPHLPARPPRDALRPVDEPPRFSVGDEVVVRDLRPSGHTRLPGYCRGRQGTVTMVHPSFVFPDTNAHARGEHPQYVYAVAFRGSTLWGADADPALVVHVDLFDDYLDPAPGDRP
jgi:nitrile hydratase subunit beta